jgi:two-component system, chemotaxis family, protein-glutamate methylesterase/glutaminase
LPGHDIIVVGASAGGVEALSRLVADLPGDLAASVFVVLHIPSTGVSVLPDILSRRTALPVRHPEDGEPIVPGHIYVAPPGRHLLVSPKAARLGQGPREHGLRPAVDTLFRSAAASHGSRVVGVVLSGTLDDGAAGLRAIKQRNGLAVVQDPDDAMYAGMPRSALALDRPDLVLPIAEIGGALVTLVGLPAAPLAARERQHLHTAGGSGT